MSKIGIKYGLLITLVVVAWVVLVRFVMGVDTEARLNLLAPLLFNLTAFGAIFLGIKERKTQLGDNFRFREGMRTGFHISLVYAISACFFFFIAFLVAGSRLLRSEHELSSMTLWQEALLAYAGLFFGAIVFGLIYSALSAFFLARVTAASRKP